MFLFELTERVHKGWDPYTLPTPVWVEKPIADAAKSWADRIPQGRRLRLVRATAELQGRGPDQRVIFSPPLLPPPVTGELALVHVRTIAGEGGRIGITSTERRMGGMYAPLSDSPCAVLWGSEFGRKGADWPHIGQDLDVIVVMPPRGTFRIVRDGHLQRLSPEMFVRWDGQGGLELGIPDPRLRDEHRPSMC